LVGVFAGLPHITRSKETMRYDVKRGTRLDAPI